MANLLATSAPSVTGTTCLQTPIVKTSCVVNEGGTAVMRFASGFAQACTCLSSPIVCGTASVQSPIVCATSYFAGNLISGTGSTCDHGSITITGSKGGYGGIFSCGWTWMANVGSSGVSGFYDSVNEQWGLYSRRTCEARLFYNGGDRFYTTTYGTCSAGHLCATDCLKSPVVCGTSCVVTGVSHSNVICSGNIIQIKTTGSKAFRIYGSGSTSTYTTTFSQGSSGGHNVYIPTGCFCAPILCGTNCVKSAMLCSTAIAKADTCLYSPVLCAGNRVNTPYVCVNEQAEVRPFSTNGLRGIQLRSGCTTTVGGIELTNNAGTWLMTQYVSGDNYGFLDASWGDWDIKKTKNGSMYIWTGSSGFFCNMEGAVFAATCHSAPHICGTTCVSTPVLNGATCLRTNIIRNQTGNRYLNVYSGCNDSAAGGIYFRSCGGTSRGYVYFDGTSNFGLLNCSGQWALRILGNHSSGDMYTCHPLCAATCVRSPILCATSCVGLGSSTYINGIVRFGTAACSYQNAGAGATYGTGDPTYGIGWGCQPVDDYGIIVEPAQTIYSGSYTKLAIGWHTGLKLGAYFNYGGTQFYANSPRYSGGTDANGQCMLMSVGCGDYNVRVNQNLYGCGCVQSPIICGTTCMKSTCICATSNMLFEGTLYAVGGAGGHWDTNRLCACTCVKSPTVCAETRVRIGNVDLTNLADTRLKLCGSGDNYMVFGPSNDNGWGYVMSVNNANGIYFEAPSSGRFAFDTAHLSSYNDAEVDVGVTNNRFRCANFSCNIYGKYLHSSTYVYAGSCVCSAILCATGSMKAPTVCGTGCLASHIIRSGANNMCLCPSGCGYGIIFGPSDIGERQHWTTGVFAANSTQARRAKILEFSYNTHHWDSGGAIIIETFMNYYGKGSSQKWQIIQTGVGGGGSGSQNCSAGADLPAGARDVALMLLESNGPDTNLYKLHVDMHAGGFKVSDYDVGIAEVYLDVDNYAQVAAKATLHGTWYNINTGSSFTTSHQYKFYNTATSYANISTFYNSPPTVPNVNGRSLYADVIYGKSYWQACCQTCYTTVCSRYLDMHGNSCITNLATSGTMCVSSNLTLGNILNINGLCLHKHDAHLLNYKSAHSTIAGIRLQSSDGTNQGYVYSESKHVGFLDGDGHWTYFAKCDTCHDWRINNNRQMALFSACLCHCSKIEAPVFCATTGFYGSGANLTSLNASNISSGTIATARLPVITATVGGVLSNADAVKFAGIATGAQANVGVQFNGAFGGLNFGGGYVSHWIGTPYNHIPPNGTSGQFLGYSASGTAAWVNSVTILCGTTCVKSPIVCATNYARVNGCMLFDQNYGHGAYGLYHSARYQHVWSMGTGYKLNVNGTDSGNLYGLSWTHTNVGGQSKAGLSHQLLIMHDGTTKSAIGVGMWTCGVSCAEACFKSAVVCATTGFYGSGANLTNLPSSGVAGCGCTGSANNCNVSLGFGAHTEGCANVNIGTNAGGNGGCGNVFIGEVNGQGSGTRYHNTSIGAKVAANLTTGCYNLFMGAGYLAWGVTTGSNNIFISQSGNPGNVSGCLMLGNNGITNGSITANCISFSGSVSKSAGSFRIVHPSPAKSETKDLWHSFVESPNEGDNIYRWQIETTNCTNTITLPDYYRNLNKDDMVWVSPDKHFGSAYGEVTTDQCCLVICSNTDGCYNVLLMGTRKDPAARLAWKGVSRDIDSNSPNVEPVHVYGDPIPGAPEDAPNEVLSTSHCRDMSAYQKVIDEVNG